MNWTPLLPLALTVLVGCTTTRPQATETLQTENLLGTWKVDLRPTPHAEPYFQELVITEVADKTFVGTFYGAPVSEARINRDWSTIRIAFVTADGSGPYHHSAVLNGNQLDGLTNATGRDFLAYWSAMKQ